MYCQMLKKIISQISKMLTKKGHSDSDSSSSSEDDHNSNNKFYS